MKKSLAIAAAVALTILSAGSASAEGNGTTQNNYNKLKTFVYANGAGDPSTCSSVAWKDVGNNGDDSPIDANDHALVVDLCDGEFGEAYSQHSLNVKTMISTIKNLSFDY